MLATGIANANNDYHTMRQEVDRMIRAGSIGTDIQRLVSQISHTIKLYFATLNTRHTALNDYVLSVPSHFKYCETFYQNLYLEMFNLMGKTENTVPLDGHTRHSVPIDPSCALNYIQKGPVCIDLVLENESVLIYQESTLKVDGLHEKLISL